MPLIKGGAIVEDTYLAVADDTPLPESGDFIVSLTRFKKDRDAILARNDKLGVRLKSDESPEAIREDVNRFSLIALDFPKFRDGRAFSWARMLRTRMHFKGEIRSTGHFLYDQINFQHRVGFDAYEVPETISLAEFKRALGEMSEVYQPSADGRKTIRELRASR
jgi:uncharacterized protein (DUF934 family)